MLSTRTINYAVPPEGYFWKWSEDFGAIEWQDGTTLALWQEVHAILVHLGEDPGLPPLGSLLLILAACRDGESSGSNIFDKRIAGLMTPWIESQLPDRPKSKPALDSSANAKVQAVIERAEQLVVSERERKVIGSILAALDSLHSLPADLRNSLAARCHLASLVFAGKTYNLSRPDSRAILQELPRLAWGFRHLEGARPRRGVEERLVVDLRALKPGKAHYKGDRLESLLRTGLEESEIAPAPIPEALENDHDPRDLLERLTAGGGEGGAAAAVARRAIAMMNFPGRFGTPRDLPVGGIADITNRGSIDRLLPGELAWDDLVLAARLVHNEALYFRREIPPQDVALSHTVLLDRGLRLWGTGRVFSLGVALGLRHHPALNGPGETFEVVAATAEAFEYLDLSTPAGVRAALEILVPAPGPEAFLGSWWDAAQIVDDPSIPDLTFITAKEHLEEPATRGLLGEIAAWIQAKGGRCRVIALSREGALEAQAWSPGGNRLLFRGELDLDEILQTSPTAAAPSASPPPLRAKADPLQAILPIYALERLPFLFPLIPQASAFLEADDGSGGGIGVSVNHRLMRWPQAGWGGEELAAELPGRQHWIGRDDHGGVIVIASGASVGEAVRVFRWDAKRLEEIEIAASRHPFPRHAAVSGGAVLLAYSDRVEALSLAKGHRVAELPIKALPAVPTLLFDGESITVIDSGRKPAFGLEAWSLSDTTRPRLFMPNGVSLEKDILRVMVAGKCLAFDPIKLTWSEAKPTPASFASFQETSVSPAAGVTLQRADWKGRREIWLDPRGLLHLRDPAHPEVPPWSILLATPAASIWNASWMLCAREPRLRLPSAEEPGSFAQVLLKDFLAATSNHRSQP
jgi:hypothetical protein